MFGPLQVIGRQYLPSHTCVIDDMRDGEDIQDWPDRLGQVISYIHTALYETYSNYDSLAIQKQKYHKLFALLAVFFGSVDIVLAILSIFLKASFNTDTEFLKIFELIAFFIAVFAIIVAFGSSLHKQWLKRRFLAEQCRLLKFRALINPFLWCSSDRSWDDRFISWKERFNTKVSQLRNADKNSLEDDLESEEINTLPKEITGSSFETANLNALTEYYQKKRLATQITYFKKRADHFELMNGITCWIPNFCFIASVVCAGGHFGIDFFLLPKNPGLQFVSQILLLFTLVLPIFSIGVRTLRSSIEVSRSATLFHAKGKALEHFNVRLTEELSKKSIQWVEILKILWQCENFFENENREWLRMMRDAEWFL